MQVAVQDIGQVTYLRREPGTVELGEDRGLGRLRSVW